MNILIHGNGTPFMSHCKLLLFVNVMKDVSALGLIETSWHVDRSVNVHHCMA